MAPQGTLSYMTGYGLVRDRLYVVWTVVAEGAK